MTYLSACKSIASRLREYGDSKNRREKQNPHNKTLAHEGANAINFLLREVKTLECEVDHWKTRSFIYLAAIGATAIFFCLLLS